MVGSEGTEELRAEIAQLKVSNERLEKAFIAITQLLESQSQTIHTLRARQPEMSTPKDTLQTEFERKLRRSRPGIIKEKLYEHIRAHDPCELCELKFVFVDQYAYTSKASFYRYIHELHAENKILKSQAGSKHFVSAATIVDART